jgi:rod shape determining protein RodA
VIAWIVYLIPLHTIKKLKYVIFGVTLLGVLLLFTPLGIELKGSNARLSVPWGTIQPGEFFKIGFVMLLGSRLLRKRGQFDELQYYVGFLIITGLLYLLFLFIPDL